MYWFGLAVLCILTQKANGGAINCCLQKYDFGSGLTASYEPRWWYDIDEGSCLAFSYSGEGGNGNNFKTQKACMHTCGEGNHYYTGMGDGYNDNAYHDVELHGDGHHGFGDDVHHIFGHQDDENYGEQDTHVDYYASSKWTAWSVWGPCSVTCGYGKKGRTRACFNTKYGKAHAQCTGSRKDSKPCENVHCPVHGGWSDWTYWDSCSVTCGHGIMTRHRSCDNPLPSYNGRTCSGKTYMTKTCNKGHCAENGGWSHWSDWGPCSTTCGHGMKRRTRACNSPSPHYGGTDCYGHTDDEQFCNLRPCHYPVDGIWEHWTKWTKCPHDCEVDGKKMFQFRKRKCIKPTYGGKPCKKGAYKQKKRCNKYPCFDAQCPGGEKPFESYEGIMVCGDSSYNPRCPAGYECYPVKTYTYHSKTLSVCCPVTKDIACHMPKDSGHCNFGYGNNFIYYYYNKETDRCEQFIYGGCGGNANRFADPYKCQETCVEKPPSKEMCLEPKYIGDRSGADCGHYYEEWYFDSDSNKCVSMQYSGCGGNKNRFYDKLQCEDVCKRQIDTSYKGDKCNLPCDHGDDSGLKELPTWYYYNKDTDTCEKFKYKGAGGNDNSFYDHYVCEEECKKKPPSIQDCYHDVDSGHGQEDLTYHYFDQYQQTCVSFQYKGLGGNKNRFPDMEYCSKVCKNREPGVSVCDLPMTIGDGYEKEDRYYYDQSSGDCKTFSYSGHGGNSNCFERKEDCQAQTKICKNTYVSQTACDIPPDSGYGDGGDDCYFYDIKSDSCKEFRYLGFGGNDNRFMSKKNCEKLCVGNKQTEKNCDVPPESGPCKAYFPRYYYNTNTGTCEQFIYGGCYGNDNNYPTKEACEGNCKKYEPQKTVCDLTKESGVGNGWYDMFYYDKEHKTCKSFVYNGAHGNGNRFVDMHTCMATCYEDDTKACGNDPHESTGNDAYWSFYYDKGDDDCHYFLHSGEIQTDENCFPDKALCTKRCKGYKG